MYCHGKIKSGSINDLAIHYLSYFFRFKVTWGCSLLLLLRHYFVKDLLEKKLSCTVQHDSEQLVWTQRKVRMSFLVRVYLGSGICL